MQGSDQPADEYPFQKLTDDRSEARDGDSLGEGSGGHNVRPERGTLQAENEPGLQRAGGRALRLERAGQGGSL